LNDRALGSGVIDHVTAYAILGQRTEVHGDARSGTWITQQRVRVEGDLTAVRVYKTTGRVRNDGCAPHAGGPGLGVFHRASATSRRTPRDPATARGKDGIAVG
jgi:hypothetical protein